MPVQYAIDFEESIEVATDGVLDGVMRVDVDGDAVRFLGRKRSLLLATGARSLIATWRPDAQSDDGDEPTVVHFAGRDSLVLYGVDETRATTTSSGTAFLVLGDDDRRPVAVVRANEVVSIRRGHPTSERPLGAIAACTQADGRLVVLGIDSTVTGDEPNVISRTRDLDGNWGGWEQVGGNMHATDIAAALDANGRLIFVACNEDVTQGANVWFAKQDSPNDALNLLRWHQIVAILGGLGATTATSVSLTTTPDGAVRLFGCNARIRIDGSNVYWLDLTNPESRSDVPHWLSSVEAAYQPDGTMVLVGLGVPSGTVGDPGDADVYAFFGTSTMRPFGSARAGQIYALRRPDGRIQCGALSDHLDETTQTNVNGPNGGSGDWNEPIEGRVRLSRIAATVGPDHSVHVVGTNAEPSGAGELLVRTEQASGESWRPWRPVPTAH